ncbi:MAG: hypothetical protein HZC25_03940 [Rhodospirillales bacterium]|nr:hypothetical protein [Rhodospirillales bacterium]
MPNTAFAAATHPVRADLVAAHQKAWERIAAPGTWLTGKRRLAVAAEIRQARQCAHCQAIKAALSPHAVKGTHQSLGELSPAEIELVHRAVSDSGRLSESWAMALLDQGLPDTEYVEIAGLVAMVSVMDACTLALGLPDTPLQAPKPGEPSRYRPPGAAKKAAWLPITEPEDAVEADGYLYPSPKAGYIYRGLSLVPQSLRDYWEMVEAHYLTAQHIYDFGTSGPRAISRPQMELMAARVSALHQCAY